VDNKLLLSPESVPDHLISSLDTREVALWVHSLSGVPDASLIQFLGLPWRLVLSEWYDPAALAQLDAVTNAADPMVRRRGFIQVIETEPARVDLPQRSLPFYLLNGRSKEFGTGDFTSRLRRMTMLEELRRAQVKHVLVLSEGPDPIPSDLVALWEAGFRAHVTFVAADPAAADAIRSWLSRASGLEVATHLRWEAPTAAAAFLNRFASVYPEARHLVRVRDRAGNTRPVDLTEIDEPERPLLDSYSLIEERHLLPVGADELPEDDFNSFFKDPTSSWRPFAAGLPWQRTGEHLTQLERIMKRLDSQGSDENCVAYIAAEPGAGGTTLAHSLAWAVARFGYPVLVARQTPFTPDPLPLTNYLKRAHDLIGASGDTTSGELGAASQSGGASVADGGTPSPTLYETPWLIVFDQIHWHGRDGELSRFRNELQKAGRPVCLLVVTGPVLGLAYYTSAVFKLIAELNHALTREEALLLGRHLDRYLKVYGKHRTDAQWSTFYEKHTVRHVEGLAAFWVTLSFWIQGQYNLEESIQDWMYRSFTTNIEDTVLQSAILQIAALSSERLPTPESLLPRPSGSWPVSQLLEDKRSELGGLGLVRVAADGEKYWALVHDILGRLLINALFFDFARRDTLGFAEARDAEHLRFLLLRNIAQNPVLGERQNRAIGEDFATTIFKIDPDHGHAGFAQMWREVLTALDTMPRSLTDTSRVFRHHTAVSRRRIAKLNEAFYGVTDSDKIVLLSKAIDDINYALTMIDYTPGSESNLNLYNSLANAYLDLAAVETVRGASRERIAELRRLANEATRRAYEESPSNSFVLETYVKNLLHQAEETPARAVELCVEALGVVLAATESREGQYRLAQLGSLAEAALKVLFKHAPSGEARATKNAVDVLVQAWTILAAAGAGSLEGGLSGVPTERINEALSCLDQPEGKGNMQVLRLRFTLLTLSRPTGFQDQLQVLQQLRTTDPRLAPQLRLEYAILLFQVGRAAEGDREFRDLRQLWKETEHFVHVPDRLRWLRAADGQALQAVNAVTASDFGTRAMARVQPFGNALVPFRPEEHGFRELRPGSRFGCHVSFSHNGPFLRPVTALPGRSAV